MNAEWVARSLARPRPSGATARIEFSRVGTDSRAVRPGELFVALRGDRFDGNAFIDEAISRGATGVVCSTGRALERPGAAFFEVADTLLALGEIARAHRRNFDVPVVAITGSNGKTTTKNLLRSVLVAAFGEPSRVLATEGNLNNLIGMPLTLLTLAENHRAAILEMGMNAFGEIARLTEIAEPTHGLITCVAPAHLEGLGSIEGVARAKGELFRGLGPVATAIVNRDDPHISAQAVGLGCRMLAFGSGTDVRAESVRALDLEGMSFELHTPNGVDRVTLPLVGRHNVANAVAAAAAAVALGVARDAIVRGLETAVAAPMRLTVERLANGVRLVNDAYNANPGSMRAAIAALEPVGSSSLVVLGDMLELGADSPALHAEIGATAARIRPRLLCAVGPFAEHYVRGAGTVGVLPDRVCAARTHEEAAEAVARAWREGDTVLVKGSRGARMEEVVVALRRLAKP